MNSDLKVAYSSIGYRLGRQFLSKTGYGCPGGKVCLDFAYKTLQVGKVEAEGFKFERVSSSEVDFFNGPDLVVGYVAGDDICQNKPLITFVYDDLDFEDYYLDSNLYQAYQAKVLFEESMGQTDQDKACLLLNHALTLMTLKSNQDALANAEQIPIILGIHNEIIKQIPNVNETMLNNGFKHDDQYVDNLEIHLYHKDTNSTSRINL